MTVATSLTSFLSDVKGAGSHMNGPARGSFGCFVRETNHRVASQKDPQPTPKPKGPIAATQRAIVKRLFKCDELGSIQLCMGGAEFLPFRSKRWSFEQQDQATGCAMRLSTMKPTLSIPAARTLANTLATPPNLARISARM
jgi:hypothetical protein